MNKIQIFNKGLINNKGLLQVHKINMFFIILMLLATICLSSTPLIIYSNSNLEDIMANQDELHDTMNLIFDEEIGCTVFDEKLKCDSEYDFKINDYNVVFNRYEEFENNAVIFLENYYILSFRVDEEMLSLSASYSNDIDFIKVHESDDELKSLLASLLISNATSFNQMNNITNAFISIGFQCIMFIGIGVLSLLMSVKLRKIDGYKLIDLFKVEVVIGLSGSLIVFFIGFFIPQFLSFNTTIFVIVVILRTFGLLNKLSK